MFKFRTVLALILVIGGLVGYALYTNQEKTFDPALQSISNKYVGRDGVFRDPTNELGLKDTNKVYIKRNGKEVQVYYGSVAFSLDPETDLNQLKNTLAALGIEIGFNQDDIFSVKYKGELVKEIAK